MCAHREMRKARKQRERHSKIPLRRLFTSTERHEKQWKRERAKKKNEWWHQRSRREKNRKTNTEVQACSTNCRQQWRCWKWQEWRENKWRHCLYNRVYAVCTDHSSRCASHTSESHLEHKDKNINQNSNHWSHSHALRRDQINAQLSEDVIEKEKAADWRVEWSQSLELYLKSKHDNKKTHVE